MLRVLAVLLFALLPAAESAANVTGTVRGVQENPILGALVTFISEANPADTFSGTTDAAGRYDIAITALAVGDIHPAPFILHQNHPNPFNPSTTISFSTADAGMTILAVYNLIGQRVRTLVNGTLPAGEHTVVWDGRDDSGSHVAAGVYLYRLAAGGYSETKKMLMLDGGGTGAGGSANMSAPPAAKPAAGAWTVTITGTDIEPREMNGLEISDGGNYDFYVIFTGEMMNFYLVGIQGETFEMGEAWASVEDSFFCGPRHPVRVGDFEMSAYEITNAQYTMYLNEALAAGEIEMIEGDPYGISGEGDGQMYIDLDVDIWGDGRRIPQSENCQIMYDDGYFSIEDNTRRNWPVVAVSWYGANAFALHYGLNLPTEAEWEYAAGGGSLEYVYATDDGTIDGTKANYNNLVGDPTAVGTYASNPFGLYDMSGNIQEWCNDWYERYPSDPDNSNQYSGETIVNPTGPATGEKKIMRGGSYSYRVVVSRDYFRTAYRNYYVKPTGFSSNQASSIIYISQQYGFRVVRRGQ